MKAFLPGEREIGKYPDYECYPQGKFITKNCPPPVRRLPALHNIGYLVPVCTRSQGPHSRIKHTAVGLPVLPTPSLPPRVGTRRTGYVLYTYSSNEPTGEPARGGTAAKWLIARHQGAGKGTLLLCISHLTTYEYSVPWYRTANDYCCKSS